MRSLLLHDLRYALRGLRRSPLFAASAIAALALGIGANTAVFSVVYAVMLKPLPYPQADRLVTLSEIDPAGRDTGLVSRGTFVDWSARAHTLEDIAAYTEPENGQTLWGSAGRYVTVDSSALSPEAFRVLRAQPILGRTFRADDRGKLVISYGFWQRAFGGAPDIVGRTITIEGRWTGEIVGVMPRGFGFPSKTDAWANIAVAGPVPAPARRTFSFHAIARLAPGASLDDARKELAAIAAQLAADEPASNKGWRAEVRPFIGSDDADVRPALLTLLAAVAAVLFVGCANVANLVLARASRRRRELAIRIALGAGTGRLVRACLIEGLLLGFCGSGVGLAIGSWLCAVLVRLGPTDIPRLSDVHLNGIVLLFAAACGLLSALFVSLAPALQTMRAERSGRLQNDARTVTVGTARARRVLIAGEVAAVVVLLTGAMLLVRTFVNLRNVDLGFDSRQVVDVSARWPLGAISPASGSVRPWPELRRRMDGLTAAIASIPGVEAAGLISDVPLTGDPANGRVWRADAPGASGLTPPTDLRDRWTADISVVTPGYFPAMGIPVLRGRNFSGADRFTDEQLTSSEVPQSGVVVINHAFASRYFPGQDPIGRTLVLSDDQAFGWLRTIVGVVADVRGHAVRDAALPAVFIPHAQHPDVFIPSIVVRSSLPLDVLAPDIRARLAAYDPHLLVQQVRPMDDVIGGALSRPKFNLLLIGAFACIALMLASVGIYGVVAFVVTGRTREIGIRIALGARARDVLHLVIADGMGPVLAGTVVGLIADAAATRALRSMLYGVTPADPASVIGAAAALVLVALLACYLPARRALRIDPLTALKEE